MTAISSQGTRVYIETSSASAKNVSNITKAFPCVVTSNAHALPVGTVVVLDGISGMTELNGRAAVITAQDTNTFTLGGIDSSNFTTYASGGTATPKTMTEVEQVRGWNRQGAPAAEIDVTVLSSTAVQRISGLPDRGSVSMPVLIEATGPGQKAVRDAVGGAAKAMRVTRSDSKAFAVMVAWNNFSDNQDLNAAHTGEFTGFISTDYAWYA